MQRELLFDVGVAYGIDCLLIDPTLGGRCDSFTTFDVSVSPENTTVERDRSANKQPLRPHVDPAVKTQRAGPQRTREPGDPEATGQGFQIHHQQASAQSCAGLARSHLSPTQSPPHHEVSSCWRPTVCPVLPIISNPLIRSVIHLSVQQAVFEPLPE